MTEGYESIKMAIMKVFADAGDELPDRHEKLVVFSAELMLWNRRFHLTGMNTVEELVEMGIYSCSRIVDSMKGDRRVVDIGSGNGLPGLVLSALAPRVNFTLVEKSPMKASFLKTAAGKMGCENVVVVTGRAEELAGVELFDSAISMAVFKPLKWLELGRNFVGQGGRVFLLHSGLQEIPEGTGSLKLVANDEYTLPWSRHRRGIAVYAKIPLL